MGFKRDEERKLPFSIDCLRWIIMILVVFLHISELMGIIRVPREVQFMTETAFFSLIPFLLLISINIDFTKRFLFFVGYLFIFGSFLTSMYADIPNAITAKYYYMEGRPNNVEIITGRTTNSQNFSINGNRFTYELSYFRPLEERKVYKITYLPNSKYVIDVKPVD